MAHSHCMGPRQGTGTGTGMGQGTGCSVHIAAQGMGLGIGQCTAKPMCHGACRLHAHCPHLFVNYITWLLWRLHKLLLSNNNPYLLLMQMAAPTVAICIGLSYRLVPVFRVPCHACAWHDSIKGLVRLALGSLFG